MTDDLWSARLTALLDGALLVWRIDASVSRDGAVCMIQPAGGGGPVFVRRVTDDGDAPYWTVSSEADPALAALLAQPFAGVQGMLRAVRDALDPTAGAQRLVMGS
ncbi:MAG: hypothetical protein HOI19_11300 [Rhodospirillaceae bacterium]|jgi:hypothetical protein|nr:hypothetical protein [Rhodospirillaceae bacterium]